MPKRNSRDSSDTLPKASRHISRGRTDLRIQRRFDSTRLVCGIANKQAKNTNRRKNSKESSMTRVYLAMQCITVPLETPQGLILVNRTLPQGASEIHNQRRINLVTMFLHFRNDRRTTDFPNAQDHRIDQNEQHQSKNNKMITTLANGYDSHPKFLAYKFKDGWLSRTDDG